MYVCVCVCVCIHTHIYVYIEREKKKEREHICILKFNIYIFSKSYNRQGAIISLTVKKDSIIIFFQTTKQEFGSEIQEKRNYESPKVYKMFGKQDILIKCWMNGETIISLSAQKKLVSFQ